MVGWLRLTGFRCLGASWWFCWFELIDLPYVLLHCEGSTKSEFVSTAVRAVPTGLTPLLSVGALVSLIALLAFGVSGTRG